MHQRALLLSIFLFLGVVSSLCPPTGSVLPAPNIPEDFLHGDLTNTLNNLIENSAEDGWDPKKTSFSVMATSPRHTFFSFHHTAEVKNETGTNEVGNDTIYMIASVSKVFTVLATWLDKRLDLDSPIGKYVQEFDVPGWEDVTLRLLTSQMAAVSRQGYLFDQARYPEILQALGFPPLNPSDIPRCELGATGLKCSRKEFLDSVLDIGFTGQVGDRVAYSNAAYMLLGMALEHVTGMSFGDVLQEAISEPLGLGNTGISPPHKRQAIIPEGESFYGLELEYFAPTGGLYSTPNDLSRFLRSILNNELLSEAKTNEWLKPTGFTSYLDNLVGAPWEIFRPTGLTRSSRPIDHYTKSGDLPGYSAYVVLVPEYDLGLSILAAGPLASGVASLLLNTVQATLVPALEDLARSQSQSSYVGNYMLNNDSSSTSVSLVIDDGPGLRFSRWINGDVDMLKTLDVAFFGSPLDKAVPVDARIYPIGLGTRWRVFVSKPENSQKAAKGSVTGAGCPSWSGVNGFYYGGVPFDEVIFRHDDSGTARELDIPVLRTKLEKTEAQDGGSRGSLLRRGFEAVYRLYFVNLAEPWEGLCQKV